MTSATTQGPTVAIVGGGFSGAAVAYHLAATGVRARILVFEPRTLLGAGLAYADTDPAHRINVPARRMSLFPDDETHFARWLRTSGALERDPAAWAGDAVFPRRLVFGEYVNAMLRPFVEEGRIVHVRDKVASVRSRGADWLVRTTQGDETTAQVLVVATTHPQPQIPSQLGRLLDDPGFIRDALADKALDRVTRTDRVLIIGSGLTGADIVASLEARGHQGRITMVSRRGLRSRGHAPEAYPPEGDFSSAPARHASRLVREIRRAVSASVAQGRGWHPVLDAARAQGGAIWAALEPDARRRLVRHARVFWDVHRFRIAPQVEAILNRKLTDGSLELRKASLGPVEREDNGIVAPLVERRSGSVQRLSFDRVILATGPAHGAILQAQPYLVELAKARAVTLDPTGLGLNTSRDGRAIGAAGVTEPPLFVAGPLARGAFGELMGLPQVSAYARFIADRVSATLSASPPVSTSTKRPDAAA